MDTTDVIIVGGGPSGLALAIALGHQKIKSVVLEKNQDICADPRAIAIAGDCTRICNVLGIDPSKFSRIGQVLTALHFHQNTFTSRPFATVDHERDWLEQFYAPGMVILQPKLERELRDLIEASDYATLRLQSTVVGINEVTGGAQAVYETTRGERVELRGKFLVGADGKRGFVRKGYLEAKGIQQLPGLYHYEGTWIAANLRVTLPTPTSHPDFPLWKLGYHPEQMWDIFWPEGFHFCTHPTKPVAAGRFGPKEKKYWRFEYELPDDAVPEDPERDLRQQMAPHLTIPGHQLCRKGMVLHENVHFPWDCVEILRCSPAFFAHKVVNKWYHEKVILIGDAAHVFPPFGAQGIANGLRDALSLSWRLALLCRPESDPKICFHGGSLLDAWSRERREGVNQSSRMTAKNGDILLSKSKLYVALTRVTSGALDLVPSVRDRWLAMKFDESSGFRGVEGGFFLEKHGGGFKTAQICLTTSSGSTQLSDEIFWNQSGVLRLLLLHHPSKEEALHLEQAIAELQISSHLFSNQILELGEADLRSRAPELQLSTTRIHPSDCEEAARTMGQPLLPHYNPRAFRQRFSPATRYVLIRPDFIVFSQAESSGQLKTHLKAAVALLQGEQA